MPRRPLHISLHYRFEYNPKTIRYDVHEKGITYSLTMEHVRLLSQYYKRFFPKTPNNQPTLAGWYADLDKATKKEVLRSGNIPTQHDGFYPDIFPVE